MSVSGQVSISSSIGTTLVFTVTGTNTLAYATAFQNILLGAGTLTENNLSTSVFGASGPGAASPNGYALTLNEITGPGNYTLPTHAPAAGDITFVDNTSVGGAENVTGSGTDDYVMFTGINPTTSYTDVGGNNTIIFTEGNNLYDGTAATGTDIVVLGTGYDTVVTGTGNTTVFSGTGDAGITLNDTLGGSFSTTLTSFNDKVYLDDGHSTVTANGVADAIFATAPGQTIIGGPDTTAGVIVTILQPSTSLSGGSGDSIYSSGASIAVFDSVGGNTLFSEAGSGQAYFVAGSNVTDTINSAGGQVYVFASAGDSINFAGTIDSGAISGFAAGDGNETLNGSGASGAGYLVFAGATPADASGINQTFIGGSGINAFITGEGNETIVAGAGTNQVYIGLHDQPANITIQDFGSSANTGVEFYGYTQDQVTAAEAAATVGGTASDPSYTIQLSDGTTVQFLGVSSLNGHTF